MHSLLTINIVSSHKIDKAEWSQEHVSAIQHEAEARQQVYAIKKLQTIVNKLIWTVNNL